MSNVTAILFLNLNLSGYCLSSIYIVNSFPDAFKFALEIPTSTLCVVRKKQKKKKKAEMSSQGYWTTAPGPPSAFQGWWGGVAGWGKEGRMVRERVGKAAAQSGQLCFFLSLQLNSFPLHSPRSDCADIWCHAGHWAFVQSLDPFFPFISLMVLSL